MTNSSVSCSITPSGSTELSSIGSCSNSEVEESSFSRCGVDAQAEDNLAEWSGADDPYSLECRSPEERLKDVQGLRTEVEDQPSSGQRTRGSHGLGTYLDYSVVSEGIAQEEVHLCRAVGGVWWLLMVVDYRTLVHKTHFERSRLGGIAEVGKGGLGLEVRAVSRSRVRIRKDDLMSGGL